MYLTTKVSKPKNPREPRQVNESLVSVSGYQKIGESYVWIDLIMEHDKLEVFKSAKENVLVTGKLSVSFYKEKLYYSIYVKSIKAVSWDEYDYYGQVFSKKVDKTPTQSDVVKEVKKKITKEDIKINNQTDEDDVLFGDIGKTNDDDFDLDALF
jgi:hypothetical protein